MSTPRALQSSARHATRTLRNAAVPSLRSSSRLPSPLSLARPLRPAHQPWRCFSTTTPLSSASLYSIGNLTDREYQDVADTAMDRLTEYLEEKLEELDVDGADVEYSSGVLTIKLGDKGTYVINKQPPNKQIWLSSPLSGPKRYDYDAEHKVWFYHRDGDLLHDLLNRELRAALGDESIEVDLAEEE